MGAGSGIWILCFARLGLLYIVERRELRRRGWASTTRVCGRGRLSSAEIMRAALWNGNESATGHERARRGMQQTPHASSGIFACVKLLCGAISKTISCRVYRNPTRIRTTNRIMQEVKSIIACKTIYKKKNKKKKKRQRNFYVYNN